MLYTALCIVSMRANRVLERCGPGEGEEEDEGEIENEREGPREGGML